MAGIANGSARAVADLAGNLVLATVEVEAPVERVFQALTSNEIVDWWVRPGVFDTREWSGDVQVGGRWESSGLGVAGPYLLRGAYVEIDQPRKLVHTYQLGDVPNHAVSTVSYLLNPIDGGTRITLRHSGFGSQQACMNTCLGWETSLARLAAKLQAGGAGPPGSGG